MWWHADAERDYSGAVSTVAGMSAAERGLDMSMSSDTDNEEYSFIGSDMSKIGR